MSAANFKYGLHVVGPTCGKRNPVDWASLLIAAAGVTPPFDPNREQYASAFHYDRAMLAHLKANGGSSAGFVGAVWSMALRRDFDAADDLAPALDAGRRFTTTVLHRYPSLSDADLEIFYSGRRSIHVELPLPHRPPPGLMFNATCRKFSFRLAKLAGVDTVVGVKFDEGNYDRVRLWRLVNSRHAKSGLFKVKLSYEELMGLSAEGVRMLAAAPRPYSPLDPTFAPVPELEHDWEQAAEAVAKEFLVKSAQKMEDAAAGGPDRLNRRTLDFIAGGAEPGDRHRLLYSAARNIGDFACPPKLAFALLMPPALDSGLSPSDAARQIECGLKDAQTASPERGCPGG